jgi:phytoene dehydrogenase-like protein
MRTEWDVIVIGGGLAGLSAAASASQLGARVLVVEAHQPGGRARTVEREGFTLNLGAHALYVKARGIEVLHDLGVRPDGAPPPLRRYRALANGEQHVLPTGPGSLLRSSALSTRSKYQLGELLVRVPRIDARALAGTSVTDWCHSLRLRSDAEAVLLGLLRLGTYLADFDELSADAAVLQLQAAAAGGVLYLHGGWSQLIDALCANLDIRSGVEVKTIAPSGDRLEVETHDGVLTATGVVVATGAPAAIRRLLPEDPGWGDLGSPPTAACLDLGVTRQPDPGYVLSLDDPLYVTMQSPPARQAPEGQAVIAAIRYGARSAVEDRPQLEQLVHQSGVRSEDVVTKRFQARLSVMGAMPRAASGGLLGRPGIEDTGVPGVTMAGDWVGPVGLLADAALASGQAAGRSAVTHRPESTTMS